VASALAHYRDTNKPRWGHDFDGETGIRGSCDHGLERLKLLICGLLIEKSASCSPAHSRLVLTTPFRDRPSMSFWDI
jgi:hypothetical protein